MHKHTSLLLVVWLFVSMMLLLYFCVKSVTNVIFYAQWFLDHSALGITLFLIILMKAF